MILTEGDGMVEAFRLDRLDSIWFVPGLRTNRQRVACSSAKSCRDYEATSARNSAGLRHRTVLPHSVTAQCYRTVLPHSVDFTAANSAPQRDERDSLNCTSAVGVFAANHPHTRPFPSPAPDLTDLSFSAPPVGVSRRQQY